MKKKGHLYRFWPIISGSCWSGEVSAIKTEESRFDQEDVIEGVQPLGKAVRIEIYIHIFTYREKLKHVKHQKYIPAFSSTTAYQTAERYKYFGGLSVTC